MSDDAQETVTYECEVCMQFFATRSEYLAHHMDQFGKTFNCCGCDEQFKSASELYDHYELHKNNCIVVENEYTFTENDQAVMNIPNESLTGADELLYILDSPQCINEVVIEGDDEIIEEPEDTSISKPENYTIVQVDHGYMLPSVFKGQLESKRRYKKRFAMAGTYTTEDDSDNEVQPEVTTPPSKIPGSAPKARPKRRHEVPDFSATNYVVLNPTEEIEIVHYKCLRCEQLFINKIGFHRHIEKGKCYINSCDVCSASFNRNSEFFEHYIVEHTDRAICNFCYRTFMYEKNVKEHMLRHLDQFRHRCEECNKGFYTVREYRNHYKNRHMGIRHKCDVCGRSFADEYYFKRHVATHEKANAIKLEFSLSNQK